MRGIPAVAVYSDAHGEFSEERGVAIAKLKSGEIRVIFSVDMFNEGVDVPSVDMVMFLRPTELPTVFLQQLGRGLRKSKGKEFLNVLDFIGNYRKAGSVRFLLTGRNLPEGGTYQPADRSEYPDDCMIDFDMRLIDLFAEMDKKHLRIRDQICNEFLRVQELLASRKDPDAKLTYQDFLAISDKEHVKKIMQMPVHYLLKSGNGFFVEKAGAALALCEDLRGVVGEPAFAEQMQDAIEYRAMDYYRRRYREKDGA